VKTFVFGDSLWDKVIEIVSFIEPLVKVLRLMDGEKLAIVFIYEGMDRAKEAIKNFCKGNDSKYLPIWKIIDSRWDRQLHSPLHAARAYLNLILFDNEGSSIKRDPEVMRGVMISLRRCSRIKIFRTKSTYNEICTRKHLACLDSAQANVSRTRKCPISENC